MIFIIVLKETPYYLKTFEAYMTIYIMSVPKDFDPFLNLIITW